MCVIFRCYLRANTSVCVVWHVVWRGVLWRVVLVLLCCIVVLCCVVLCYSAYLPRQANYFARIHFHTATHRIAAIRKCTQKDSIRVASRTADTIYLNIANAATLRPAGEGVATGTAIAPRVTMAAAVGGTSADPTTIRPADAIAPARTPERVATA